MGVELASAVKSADRILELFEMLARRPDGMTHQAIADALEIPKSSLTKLLQTAIGRGFVAYTAGDRRYRLGERFGTTTNRKGYRVLHPKVRVLQGDGVNPAELTIPLQDSWPTYNGDYSGKRYSDLKQINQSNVKQLTLAWMTRVNPGMPNPSADGFGRGRVEGAVRAVGAGRPARRRARLGAHRHRRGGHGRGSAGAALGCRGVRDRQPR